MYSKEQITNVLTVIVFIGVLIYFSPDLFKGLHGIKVLTPIAIILASIYSFVKSGFKLSFEFFKTFIFYGVILGLIAMYIERKF